MRTEYNILIGGEAGQGSRKAGLIIAKLFNNLGYRVFVYDDYQSLVRGGHSFSCIRASKDKVLTHKKEIDYLLCLDKRTYEEHGKNLKGIAIFNKDKVDLNKGIGIRIESITRELGGIPLMANTALIGGFAKVIGVSFIDLKKILIKEIKKGIDLNLKIAKHVYDSVEKKEEVKKIKRKALPLLTGNEALSLGAVSAGLEKYYAYPMTPASGILHFLAGNYDLGVETIQLENEISVANAAIGSAYAGRRVMIGTSGGGFALMTEALSLAAMAETPIVIVNSQRSAPATGVPTYTGQSDLNFVLGAGHGDFLRFVVAPGDADESFEWGGRLMNLVWKYQTPGILLIDKHISESTFNLEAKEIKKEGVLLWNGKGEYARYRFSENGISPLAFPGDKNAVVKATSYEHDEHGITIEEDVQAIKKMQDKRLRKFKEMQKWVDKERGSVKVYGNKKSKTAVIAWGSTKSMILEAVEKMGVKLIQPVILQPFPEKRMKKELEGVKKIIVVEQNAFGQLNHLLNCHGIKTDKTILKYDSRPFVLEEIEKELKKAI